MKVLGSLILALTLLVYSSETSLGQEEQVTLLINPPTQSVAPQSSFSVEIRLNTSGENINTVKAYVTYDPTFLSAQSVDTTGSFVTIWFENNIASANGEVQLTGSVPSPGVNGDNLLFATINFTSVNPTTTQLQFKEESAVFRDTDNVNILAQTQGSVITVTTDSVTPTTAPGSLTPTPTVGPGTPLPTQPTTSPTLGPITPTGLPDVGTTSPTVLLFVFGVILFIIAIAILL